MPSIQVKNLGPAFVMAGDYGDTASWHLVGQPEHYSNPDDESVVFDYDEIGCLDGLINNVSINIETPTPSASKSAGGSPYGAVIRYGSEVTLTLETTVATAWSLMRLCGTTDLVERPHLGDTIETTGISPAPEVLPASWTYNRPGLGVKPAINVPYYLDIEPGTEDHDINDWWFPSVYPTQGTTVSLSNATGEDSQSNFTFNLKVARLMLDVTGDNLIQHNLQLGGQLDVNFVRQIYGDVPSWSTLIPALVRNQ